MSTSVNKQWPSVGMKCVCIKGWKPTADWRGIEFAAEVGSKYTVRAVHSFHNGVGILVEEIHNPVVETSDTGMAERYFPVTHFRPLITKTQEEDIAEMWKLVRDIPAEGKLDLISELLDQ